MLCNGSANGGFIEPEKGDESVDVSHDFSLMLPAELEFAPVGAFVT